MSEVTEARVPDHVWATFLEEYEAEIDLRPREGSEAMYRALSAALSAQKVDTFTRKQVQAAVRKGKDDLMTAMEMVAEAQKAEQPVLPDEFNEDGSPTYATVKARVRAILGRSEDYYRRWLANDGPDEAIPLSTRATTPTASELVEALRNIREKASQGMSHGLTADATCEDIMRLADAALATEAGRSALKQEGET